MPNIESLLATLQESARLVNGLIQDEKRLLVVTHIDADGLASGAITFQSLAREGALVSLRAVADLDRKVIDELAQNGFDFYVFTDLASGLLEDISSSLGDSFLVVDHHQLPQDQTANPRVLNAWKFGYDGGTEVCSASMAYMLASALDDKNKDMSPLAVVGAVGDRQDVGPGRALTGLNKKAVEDSVGMGLLNLSTDFLFHGRETRPIHEAIAQTYSPFIPLISGSKDSALAVLSNAGLSLKDGFRWRTLSELSKEEKQKLLDVLAGHLAPSGDGGETIAQLIGEVYSLQSEDSFTPLKDAREFATVLNACGRMDRTDIGFALCLGNRDSALSEGLKVISDYRARLSKAIRTIEAEEKSAPLGDLAIVRGDDFLEERLTGAVSSILASNGRYSEKLVLVRAKSGESELKFSIRMGDRYTKKVNLGLIMREAALLVGGVGGGHSMAAGAKVVLSRGDEFAKAVSQMVLQ